MEEYEEILKFFILKIVENICDANLFLFRGRNAVEAEQTFLSGF